MSIVIPEIEETEAAVVDGAFLEACLKRQLESLLEKADEGYDFSSYPHAIKSSSEVWVKDDRGAEIRAVTDVIRMLHALTDIQQVAAYSGSDHKHVYVLNGALPESWSAQVKSVMVRHLPAAFLKDGADKVFLAEMLPLGKSTRGKRKLVCRGVAGGAISTSAAWETVPKKEVMKYYHNVTLKITRGAAEEQRLLSWLPGLDVRSNVCDGLDGQFVELHEKKHFGDAGNSRLRFRDLR